ncbi:hypothetical protein Tcan_00365 [Toxocara canis]|uniref:Uncharacterized protein n=1 Tax=Toxocara canis TaxID=6265 RepID=A0A0B2VCB7_TOXCA|nr:hypothetical protein Tcan_00365 [Toxocara canis]
MAGFILVEITTQYKDISNQLARKCIHKSNIAQCSWVIRGVAELALRQSSTFSTYSATSSEFASQSRSMLALIGFRRTLVLEEFCREMRSSRRILYIISSNYHS